MISIETLRTVHPSASVTAEDPGYDPEYELVQPLNLYDSPQLTRLATQAIAGRHLRLRWSDLPEPLTPQISAIPVRLCEDDYPGWLNPRDLGSLIPCALAYHPVPLDAATIQARIPAVIDYTHQAMAVENEYLWGGTLGPNFDCSGLVQRAFGSQGIWLPRDAYQQEAFSSALPHSAPSPQAMVELLVPGDLIFFGTPAKATHVALYLGQGRYIHSSGKDQGRNRIGIDSLVQLDHPVSQTYHRQFRGAGRVVESYRGNQPWVVQS